MLNRKVIIIHSLVGLIKRTLYKMSQYFPKLYRTFGRNIMSKLICLITQKKPFKERNRS